MDFPRRGKKPVAIVALGDPAMGDDGVAIRVMGRVRPILGEIALTGCGGADVVALKPPLPAPPAAAQPPATRRPPKSAAGTSSSSTSSTSSTSSSTGVGRASSRASKLPIADPKGPHSLIDLVDWIEGLCPDELLRPVLSGRKRVVLIDAVFHDCSPGHVRHWHISHRPESGLNTLSFYGPEDGDSLDHLPFWLEDDMPPHGTDLIAIEPYKIAAHHDLSIVMRSRLAGITAQVGGLLVRILEEEGWQFGPAADPPQRTRRKRVA